MHAVCVCVGLKSCGVLSCATKHHAVLVKKRVTHDHGGGEKYELFLCVYNLSYLDILLYVLPLRLLSHYRKYHFSVLRYK